MTITAIRHWALNITTGEVLGSSTGNALRRHVRRNVRWDITHGYGAGTWLFFHCSEAQMHVAYQARIAKRGGEV